MGVFASPSSIFHANHMLVRFELKSSSSSSSSSSSMARVPSFWGKLLVSSIRFDSTLNTRGSSFNKIIQETAPNLVHDYMQLLCWLYSQFLKASEPPVTSKWVSTMEEVLLEADMDRNVCQMYLLRHGVPLHQNRTLKSWVLSGSPQSTLSAVGTWSSNGSPNRPSQAPSPPTTPYGVNEDSWDLIYAAVGRVAILNKSGDWVPNCREQQFLLVISLRPTLRR
ncbi:hypothetical protein LguiA_012461 [Lonicera macranthoides]